MNVTVQLMLILNNNKQGCVLNSYYLIYTTTLQVLKYDFGVFQFYVIGIWTFIGQLYLKVILHDDLIKYNAFYGGTVQRKVKTYDIYKNYFISYLLSDNYNLFYK